MTLTTINAIKHSLYAEWIRENLTAHGVRVQMVGDTSIFLDGDDVATARKAARFLVPLGFEYECHGNGGMTFTYPEPPRHPFAPR